MGGGFCFILFICLFYFGGDEGGATGGAGILSNSQMANLGCLGNWSWPLTRGSQLYFVAGHEGPKRVQKQDAQWPNKHISLYISMHFETDKMSQIWRVGVPDLVHRLPQDCTGWNFADFITLLKPS